MMKGEGFNIYARLKVHFIIMRSVCHTPVYAGTEKQEYTELRWFLEKRSWQT
jgi:hypothetical protein